MSFRFSWLCELLDELESNISKKRASSVNTSNIDHVTVVAWFSRHRSRLTSFSNSAVALLSCLFPERRPDRVFALREKRLLNVFSRALGLNHGSSRRLRLIEGEIATSIAKVMREAEFDLPRSPNQVTVEEIDLVLERVATRSNFSSPSKKHRTEEVLTIDLLQPLIRRLQSFEAKWLVRLLLKSHSPVIIPEWIVFHQFHFLLPDLLDFQNDFRVAIRTLGDIQFRNIPSRVDNKAVSDALRGQALMNLQPQVGVMIRRLEYDKARSIKHCLTMISGEITSVERKYDGEYCQIHIDLEAEQKEDRLKIFSKSGKNSTSDRVLVHDAIWGALRPGQSDGQIKSRVILEGELLVYSTIRHELQPFHMIRKHVNRSGRMLGVDADSLPDPTDQLMIMFYDVLLLDDVQCLRETYKQRRQRLENLVLCIEGQSDIAWQQNIDFSAHTAKKQLQTLFADGVSKGWEGFVLRQRNVPFFAPEGRARCIKLKKDYIAGLGDSCDLLVVGGRKSCQTDPDLDGGKLLWTSFYVACLENKEPVQRFGDAPRYRLLNVIKRPCISREDILQLNELCKAASILYDAESDMSITIDQAHLSAPTHVFCEPVVVELLGSGFERPSNVRYLTLRHARITKIHHDRSVLDTVDFAELQDMAATSMKHLSEEPSQDDREWLDRLRKADCRSSFMTERSTHSASVRSSIVSLSPRTPLKMIEAPNTPGPSRRGSKTSPTSASQAAMPPPIAKQVRNPAKSHETAVTPNKDLNSTADGNRVSRPSISIASSSEVFSSIAETSQDATRPRRPVTAPETRRPDMYLSLKKTSPWRKWSGQMPFKLQFQKLFTRRNTGGCTQKGQHENLMQLDISEGNHQTLIRKRQIEMVSESKRKRSKLCSLDGADDETGLNFRCHESGSLPIPPTSSAEETDPLQGKEAKVKDTRELSEDITNSNRNHSDMTDDAVFASAVSEISISQEATQDEISVRALGAVLTSNRLKSLPEERLRQSEQLLERSPLTFTDDMSHFLSTNQRIVHNPGYQTDKTMLLVLTDVEDHDAVALEMFNLKKALQNDSHGFWMSAHVPIVFADWNIIRPPADSDPPGCPSRNKLFAGGLVARKAQDDPDKLVLTWIWERDDLWP